MTRKIEQVRFAESAPKKKRVAAYARVSSGKDAMLHSLSAQVSYYSDYIQSTWIMWSNCSDGTTPRARHNSFLILYFSGSTSPSNLVILPLSSSICSTCFLTISSTNGLCAGG